MAFRLSLAVWPVAERVRRVERVQRAERPEPVTRAPLVDRQAGCLADQTRQALQLAMQAATTPTLKAPQSADGTSCPCLPLVDGNCLDDLVERLTEREFFLFVEAVEHIPVPLARDRHHLAIERAAFGG